MVPIFEAEKAPGEILTLPPIDFSQRMRTGLDPAEVLESVDVRLFKLPDYQTVLDEIEVPSNGTLEIQVTGSDGQQIFGRRYVFKQDVTAAVRIPEIWEKIPAPDLVADAAIDANDPTKVTLTLQGGEDMARYWIEVWGITNHGNRHLAIVRLGVREPVPT